MKNYCFKLVIRLIFGLMTLCGCTASDSDDPDAWLIRVRESVVGMTTFQRAYELARIDYAVEEDDTSSLSELRQRILNQLMEEAIIKERAKDLNISISDAELEEAVLAIRKDYPDNTFEEVFLENAVSYNVWRERYRTRLLMERVITKELRENVEITPEDITEYYEKNYLSSDEKPYPFDENNNINETIVNQLKREKAEQSYKGWIDQLYKIYGVEINWDVWRKFDTPSTEKK